MRLFNEHTLRKVTSLNGTWRMIPDNENKGLELGYNKELPGDAKAVILPSVWNFEEGLFRYFGVCWYEKDIVTETENILISFGAVTGYAKVYFDGELLGEHYGGFSAFHFTKRTTAGKHRITVSVDASSDAQTIPLPYVDWYHYGGIIRDVELAELRDAYIESAHYEYELSPDLHSAQVNAVVTLYSFSDVKVPLEFTFDEKIAAKTEISLKQEEKTTVTLGPVKVDNVRLWDIYRGELYSCGVSTDTDDLLDRIGFRKIEVAKKKILLNGKEIYIKGVNRHEEHPDWGFAVPAQINKRDIEIIKNMNCNAIRGSHYPNSRIFMDMLDKEGILFYGEIPMWGFSADRMADPVVLERGLNMHREMTEQYYNHPSVVMWGLNNECATNTSEGRKLCKVYAEHLRKKGGNRLITFASNVIETDICLDLVDVVSVNKYIGWYGEALSGWKKFIPWLRTRLADAGVPDKPIILSEYGAAAVYGYTSFDEGKWSEEYQAKLLCEVSKLCANEPGIVGTYAWQYCDIRSENELNRARGYNNKGLVNEYRRPKLAYYAMKELYGRIK